MRNKIPLHARSHGPGGSDPIASSGSSGIQFDTNPQPGGFLRIDATSYIRFNAASVIRYDSLSNIQLNDNGGGGIYLTSISAGAGGGFIGLQCDGATGIVSDTLTLNSTNGSIEIQASNSSWVIFEHSQQITITLGATKNFLIRDHLGASLLKVNEAGTFEILTGATWTSTL